MNILYISYDGATDPLGQSQILPYLGALSEEGNSFILLTFEKKLPGWEKLVNKVSAYLKEEGIKWLKMFYHKNPPVLSTLFDISCGVIGGIKAIKREKITVVHARSYVAALIAFILKKIFRLRFVFDMRGFWAEERVEGKIWKRKGILYWIVKSLEKAFLKSADQIIVLTRKAKAVLEAWGYPADNISIIPCCTDTENFRLTDNSRRKELRSQYDLNGKFIFVHTGSLEYWYMKEQILDYFKVAKEILPNAHFLILTQYDKEKIRNLILDKGLSLKDFSFISAPFSQMPDMLAMADAGIILITPVFSKIASCPTKFAEYLACGLPVIINDKIGDMENYVLENRIGVVVRDFNHSEYRRTFEELLSLIQDKDLPTRCRVVASGEFGLKTGAKKYSEAYARLG